MSTERGNLSINSENIFPIIKKWLYSDQDIFIREMISNGCDAITKLRKLEVMGEYQFPEGTEFSIQVIANPTDKTLKFIDNGIGMTADEIKEYINQIAFSGATDFLNKYKDKANEDQIIGHFGLGFYSAFMVADKVEIESLSYKDGSEAVHWECDGGTEFEMGPSDKSSIGTEITLHLNEDCYEYSNEYRVREVLNKYCSFMPEEIYLVNTDTLLKKDENAKDEEPKPINDTHPLWGKHPNECTEAEYKEFYRKVFNDYKDPLFWIHLNMDYPFNLKGILYFPRLDNKFDTIEGTIKLYNNQVFIADNIKEVIPEFLLLLKGVIDCPDLPLNVSRSALQNDGFVNKISDYITKKVADKLSGMYKTERENYEKYWDDISPFIKFGCIRDEKFAEKMDEYVLYKNIDDKYMTLSECLEENKEKHENTVFYVNARHVQGQYINMFRKAKLDAVYLEQIIDTAFIQHIEQKNEGVHFVRVDADLDKVFTKRTSKADQAVLDEKAEVLQAKLREKTGSDKLVVKVQNLKNTQTSSVLTVAEETKRMEDWMRQMGMSENMEQFKDPGTLVLNANNDLVKIVLDDPDGENSEIVLEQLYDLAKLANAPLSTDEMTKFIERSNRIMLLLAGDKH
ncbi:MAG: molecular chaperone HtpG [Lachnospiraceae bacterium]|nr:molecular chaperone HtpG [Lachnospiraceae bacterium]